MVKQFNEKERRGRAKKKEKMERKKWMLRDQPYVRLASGDMSTSDAARTTILLFTAGEGDKRTLTKGRGRKQEMAGLPLLPSGQQPHLQVQHLLMKARTKRWMFFFHQTGVKAPLKQICETD